MTEAAEKSFKDDYQEDKKKLKKKIKDKIDQMDSLAALKAVDAILTEMK